MIVKGLTLSEIERCAELVPCKVVLSRTQPTGDYRGSVAGIAFVIRPTEATGEAFRVTRKYTGRRVAAINAEGHYVLFSLLFNHGATRIETSLATFNSKVELEQKAKEIIAKGGWQGN